MSLFHAASATPRDDDKPLTVSGFCARLKNTLAETFPGSIRIVGEVSGLRDRSHLFFSLKDDDAVLHAVMFATKLRRDRYRPRDGDRVIATGRIDHYPPQGKLQLYVDALEPAGQGDLDRQLKLLTEQLRQEGLFDLERKRELPVFAQHLAVVTSRSAAAWQDVIDTARRRWPGCRLTLIDVRVQGDGAAAMVAHALDSITNSPHHHGFDAVLLTRGGGSLEDLWAFNEPGAVYAVARCGLPVVAAIGHETDTTLAELAADARAATPTQAAMMLVPDREAMAQQLDQLTTRLNLSPKRRVEAARQALDRLARRAPMNDPKRLGRAEAQRLLALEHRLSRSLASWVQQQRDRWARAHQQLSHALPRRLRPCEERLAGQTASLERALVHRLDAQRTALGRADEKLQAAGLQRHADALAKLARLQEHLDALAPQRVLERGFTVTRGADGQLLRSANDAAAQGQIVTVFHDGEIQSTPAQER